MHPPNPDRYYVPRGPVEARRLLRKLRSDMRSIELQLGNPDRRDRFGNRMPVAEYRRWRSRALFCLDNYQEHSQLIAAYLSEVEEQRRDGSYYRLKLTDDRLRRLSELRDRHGLARMADVVDRLLEAAEERSWTM